MKLIANISRILVGIVFVFSGFVKGVDPLGTAYRLEDYFIAFNWTFFIPLALFFSILLCTIEFVTGIMMLLNLKMKISSWVLLLMMVFFTLLTLNDAINNPVPDCGCFGDAIKLTNWQTFYKNLVLLPMAVFIFMYRKKFRAFAGPGWQWAFTAFFTVLFAGFSYRCYSHLPAVDFTEWKAGHKLYPENPKPVKYFLTYKNKATGETKEYLSPNYPFSDSVWMAQWEFVAQRVEDPNHYYGKSLVITDTTGNNITESIIRNPGYQLVINAYDLTKTDVQAFKKLDEFCAKAYADDIPAVVLVSAENAQIRKFALENNLHLEFCTADDIILKTIVRSNPGLLVMKDGVILEKWHHNDFPDYPAFKSKFVKK
ncbi:MAG TPA: DoxX family protein [Bacteroidales bacterium]|nr:DoxX family protein [Bacteroidales bacterium]